MASSDQLTASLLGGQTRRLQHQEYFLQASLVDEVIDTGLQRIRSLCDLSDDDPATFRDHEIVYSIKEPNGVGQTVVRARHSLDTPDQPWTLLYLGQIEHGDKSRPTMVRTYVEVSVTSNICTFLQDMGFVMEYEFITSGWIFRKNRIKTLVYKVHQIPKPNNLEQTIPLTNSHCVEVSLIASSSNEHVTNELVNFADQLKPLINLEKTDLRR